MMRSKNLREEPVQTAERSAWFAELDRSWFEQSPQHYLESAEFVAFEQIAGVRLGDLCSNDSDVVGAAQQRLVDQSVVMNEVQKDYSGYSFPFLVYTQCFDFCEKVKHHNLEVDSAILRRDMCDSLRRRHMALSHAILPRIIEQLYNRFREPIVVKNLGSGVGLDTINAAKHTRQMVGTVWNCDLNEEAVELGKAVSDYLIQRGEIDGGVLEHKVENMTKSSQRAHLIVQIGIICGLTDDAATILLTQAHKQLHEDGTLVVSSSNHNMRSRDALCSFLMQHIGTRESPLQGWGLNFREKTRMRELLQGAGFASVEIYHDAQYPGHDQLGADRLYGVDPLPATVRGYDIVSRPLLPDMTTLSANTGYNWIAVGQKV